MNLFGMFFTVLLIWNNAYALDVVDYLSRFFGKYDYSKIVYFLVECDSSSIANTVDVVKQLNTKWPGEEMNVITVAYNQHTGTRSTIYTNNLRQLQEALERYSCNATITYNHEPPRAENFLSILTTIVNQLHYNETIFLFTITERNGNWPDELQRKLEDKNIQINAVVSESSNRNDPLVTAIRNIGGRVFSFRAQESRGWSSTRSDLGMQSFGYTYKIKAIRKENLMENSRITFPLAEATSSIILLIEGALHKCLLISPSGVMINLLPVQTRTNHQFERPPSTTEPILNLRMPIYESPAEWTLSASGIAYNATMTMMIKTRLGMNEEMYSRGRDGFHDATYSNTQNENAPSPYRPYLDPNKDQWTGSFQSNSPNKDQWAGSFLPNSPNKNQWTGNFQPNSANKDQWTDNWQSNSPASVKRYENAGFDGGLSPYDAEKSNRIRSTESNAASVKRYDNEGPPLYGAQSII